MLLSHQGGESSELEALGIQREDRRRRSLLFGFGAPAFFKAAITVTLSPENKLRISRGKIVTRYNHQPDPALRPKSKLETAFHKADDSIRNIIQLLEAA